MLGRGVKCRLLAGLLLLVGAPLTGSASPESAAQLVARSIEHHGGELYRSTRSELSLCSKSGCSQLEVTRDGGLYEYCATAKVEAGERRVCASNERVEEFLDGVPVGGSPARDAALRDWVMERVYFAFLPSRLDDPSVRLQDLGLEEWGERRLRKVKVTFEAGTSTDDDDEFLYWFDPESARLELFGYSYSRNDGGIRFRKLENYRRVGGILFFDQQNFGVDGPGLSVDLLSEGYLRDAMRHVSTVELREVTVEPLQRVPG